MAERLIADARTTSGNQKKLKTRTNYKKRIKMSWNETKVREAKS